MTLAIYSRAKQFLSDPAKILLLLALLLPFERIPSVNLAGVSIRPPLIVAAWFIVVAFFRFGRSLLPSTLAERSFTAFIFVSIIAGGLSNHLLRSTKVVIFTLFVFVMALAIARTLASVNLTSLKRWLVWGAVIACSFAVYQFIGDLLGLSTSFTGLRTAYTKAVFGFPRSQSTALEPLYFADYLLLPLAVVLVTKLRERVPMGLVGLIFLCIFITVSRGGIVAALLVAIIAASAYFLTRRWPDMWRTIGGVAVGGLLAAFFIVGLVPLSQAIHHQKGRAGNSAQTFEKQATHYEIGDQGSDRAITRNFAEDLFKSHPFLGVGPGDFGIYIQKAKAASYSSSQIVNNLPLEILAETGAIGGLAFLGFILSIIYCSWKAFKKLSLERKLWLAASLLFLFAAAVQYQTFSTLYIIHIWFGIGLVFGLIRMAVLEQVANPL